MHLSWIRQFGFVSFDWVRQFQFVFQSTSLKNCCPKCALSAAILLESDAFCSYCWRYNSLCIWQWHRHDFCFYTVNVLLSYLILYMSRQYYPWHRHTPSATPTAAFFVSLASTHTISDTDNSVLRILGINTHHQRHRQQRSSYPWHQHTPSAAPSAAFFVSLASTHAISGTDSSVLH